MSKQVRSETRSDADVESVFRTLTDESWAGVKAARFRDDSRTVSREERPDGGVTLVVSRRLPDGVPGFLQRFLPEDGRITEHFAWGPDEGGTRRGTWHADIAGAPAKLGGTMLLEPTASGSRHVIEGEVRVKVPIVGGKAESFIAEMVEKLAGKEADLLLETVSRG